MANDQKPEILEKLRQEPISESEADELRAGGRGFTHEQEEAPEVKRAGSGGASSSAGRRAEAPEDRAAVARRAHGNEQLGSHRALNEREGVRARGSAGTGDESTISRQRAEGRFESEGERTQLEEDFGERGLRLPDYADNTNAPSILDPEAE